MKQTLWSQCRHWRKWNRLSPSSLEWCFAVVFQPMKYHLAEQWWPSSCRLLVSMFSCNSTNPQQCILQSNLWISVINPLLTQRVMGEEYLLTTLHLSVFMCVCVCGLDRTLYCRSGWGLAGRSSWEAWGGTLYSEDDSEKISSGQLHRSAHSHWGAH